MAAALQRLISTGVDDADNRRTRNSTAAGAHAVTPLQPPRSCELPAAVAPANAVEDATAARAEVRLLFRMPLSDARVVSDDDDAALDDAEPLPTSMPNGIEHNRPATASYEAVAPPAGDTMLASTDDGTATAASDATANTVSDSAASATAESVDDDNRAAAAEETTAINDSIASAADESTTVVVDESRDNADKGTGNNNMATTAGDDSVANASSANVAGDSGDIGTLVTASP